MSVLLIVGPKFTLAVTPGESRWVCAARCVYVRLQNTGHTDGHTPDRYTMLTPHMGLEYLRTCSFSLISFFLFWFA